MTYGLIVGGGKPDINGLGTLSNQASYVIAADQGYGHFASAGWNPMKSSAISIAFHKKAFKNS